jgi:hypothetical protein
VPEGIFKRRLLRPTT